jgi:hypothetical protein
MRSNRHVAIGNRTMREPKKKKDLASSENRIQVHAQTGQFPEILEGFTITHVQVRMPIVQPCSSQYARCRFFGRVVPGVFPFRACIDLCIRSAAGATRDPSWRPTNWPTCMHFLRLHLDCRCDSGPNCCEGYRDERASSSHCNFTLHYTY